MPHEEPQIRVWQPQGFEGLELTELNSSNTFYPKTYLTSFTVGVRLEGVRRTVYRRRRYITVPSSFLVYQPGEVLTASPFAEGRYRYKNMSLSPSLYNVLLQGVFEKALITQFLHMVSPHRRLNEQFFHAYLACHASFTQSASLLERETKLLELVVETIQHFADKPPSERRIGLEHRAVSLVKGHLRDRPAYNVALDELAALTGLNKWYLVEVFKQYVGVTPHQYQMALRIVLAKKLLCIGLPAAQVALSVGFADQSHLTRVFKKYITSTARG